VGWFLSKVIKSQPQRIDKIHEAYLPDFRARKFAARTGHDMERRHSISPPPQSG
jgi:hypothetical protein